MFPFFKHIFADLKKLCRTQTEKQSKKDAITNDKTYVSSRQGLALISSSNEQVFQVARKCQTVDCGSYIMQDLGEKTLNKTFASCYL